MVYLPEPITGKEVEDGGDVDKFGSSFGVCGMQGWRRNMEDSHLAAPDFDRKVSLYGVFDGHGGRGVARYAAKRLPELLRETEAYKREDYGKALEQAFLTIDEKLKEPAGRMEIAELDQPDATDKANAKPIEVPMSILRRMMASKGQDEQKEVNCSSSSEQATVSAEASCEASAEVSSSPFGKASVEAYADSSANGSADVSGVGSAGASIDASHTAATSHFAGSSDPSGDTSNVASADCDRESQGGQRHVEEDKEEEEEEKEEEEEEEGEEVALIDPARLRKDASP